MFPDTRRLLTFLAVLGPAILGGWGWSWLNLPLGWLMGAAIVTGATAMSGVDIRVFKLPHRAGLIVIGTSVGLTLTPDVAVRMVGWLPLMVFSALLGIVLALIAAPLLARWGGMSRATAYFSLLPGGVIEMAKVGESYGADRTTIAALHAIRVALVVGLLPLILLTLLPADLAAKSAGIEASLPQLVLALAVGALGGWIGARVNLPAAWLLGAVLSVGVIAASGVVAGRVPGAFLAAAQVVVGMALGERFQRDRLARIPRAIAAGLPTLLGIMAVMALAATGFAVLLHRDIASLVLAFSIGGMAEMVLTAKALHQDVALVAAFQALRGVLVNATAGQLWHRTRRWRGGSGGESG
ncbi:MAG: AbrB family transcriptional regulator [Hyphomicrobiaceae bacterium]